MIRKTRLFITAVLALTFMTVSPVLAAESCGGTQTHFISCDSESGVGAIGDLIKIVVNVLTVLIGVVATGGIAYAGFLYASARDSRDKVNEALKLIRNIVIGLLLYGFIIAILNWLIPGGVIG